MAAWGGLEGLCTPDRRCTDCLDQPQYIFADISKKARATIKKAEARKRQTAREKAKQEAQRLAAAPQLPQLHEITAPVGSSTPKQGHDIDSLPFGDVSIHSSDLASITSHAATDPFSLSDAMSVIGHDTDEGTNMLYHGTPVVAYKSQNPMLFTAWVNVTDMDQTSRTQLCVYATSLLNVCRQRQGLPILVNPIQPVYFTSKPAVTKPRVSTCYVYETHHMITHYFDSSWRLRACPALPQ